MIVIYMLIALIVAEAVASLLWFLLLLKFENLFLVEALAGYWMITVGLIMMVLPYIGFPFNFDDGCCARVIVGLGVLVVVLLFFDSAEYYSARW